MAIVEPIGLGLALATGVKRALELAFKPAALMGPQFVSATTATTAHQILCICSKVNVKSKRADTV